MRNFTRAIFCACCYLFLLSFFQRVSGQTGIVRGTINNTDGHPLSGVSMTVEGNRTGASTDEGGHYLLTLKPGQYTIRASYIGRSVSPVSVVVQEGKTNVQDFVIPVVSGLDEVVVVGSRSRD